VLLDRLHKTFVIVVYLPMQETWLIPEHDLHHNSHTCPRDGAEYCRLEQKSKCIMPWYYPTSITVLLFGKNVHSVWGRSWKEYRVTEWELYCQDLREPIVMIYISRPFLCALKVGMACQIVCKQSIGMMKVNIQSPIPASFLTLKYTLWYTYFYRS